MYVADRLSPFGSTIFAQMTGLAIKHNAVNLSQGYPDFEGPPEVKQAAIDALNAGHNQYARSQGVPPLNEAIADFFAKSGGFPVDPTDEITVTAGCTEAIAATMIGLVNPGEEVILFEPYYDSYRATVAMAGATPRFVTLRAPDFTFDEAELRAAFTPKTKAILVNTPHNPTGHVFSREELTLIAQLCIEHNVIAVADEVYERLVFEGEHIHIATLPGMTERTITLSSLGKTFSFTGWKIGWAIARPELSRAVRAAHQFLVYAQATPLQHAAAAALRMPPSYYDEFLREYRERRDLLCSGLTALGFNLRPPQGSYFVLADHTPFGFEDDVAFCKHLTTEVGVAAIPPTAFYENKSAGRALVRFAFCKKIETLELALERMQALKPIART
jgi:aspartate/methionine/tyrosine aminotransferase